MKEVISAYKAQEMLKSYASVAKSQLVKSYKDIKLKTPLVLKIVSVQALHKTELNGIRIVKNKDDVEKSFNELTDIAKKRKIKLEGILVQEFVSGQELIIGIKKDSVFGHVIVFGVGGIFTELLKDTSTRKCPITIHDAQDMTRELRSSALFNKEGFRGKKLNTSILEKTLVKISQLPAKNKRISELDINPFMLNDKNGCIVDARIILA